MADSLTTPDLLSWERPPRRATAAQRAQNQAAADAFFTRPVTTDLQARILQEAGTPPVLLDAWRRDCERARAAFHAADSLLDDLAEKVRALERGRAERREREQERRQRDRDRAVAWGKAHPEQRRAQRERYKDRHPDRVRQSYRHYHERHRDEVNAKARQRAQDNPAARRDAQHRHYETHREELMQYQREYRADPDRYQKVLAYNREWKRRERRRIAAGLPPRRLHTVTAAERRDNQAAADAFFARPITKELRARLRTDEPTPPGLIAAWHRETARFRAAHGYDQLESDLRDRHTVADARRAAALARQEERNAVRAAEGARMDQIARTVNARLRLPPPARRVHHNDPAAPHTPPGMPPPPPRGIGR